MMIFGDDYDHAPVPPPADAMALACHVVLLVVALVILAVSAYDADQDDYRPRIEARP